MDWQQLARFFPDTMLEWRIVERAENNTLALVRPQVQIQQVLSHLDALAGRSGWSNSFFMVGNQAVGCALTISGVAKSVVLPLAYPNMLEDAAQRADDALVQAAERFGILPEADVSLCYWVEADPEAGTILHEPTEIQRYPKVLQVLQTSPSEVGEEGKLDARPLGMGNLPPKPSGQMMIDKLLERLKQEGRGLEAAKLVITHKGYGNDADEAKRLYGKLRDLLKQASATL